MGRMGGSAPLTSRLRGARRGSDDADSAATPGFEAPILPPETGHGEEQIGKSELLTNCLPPDSRKLELFNYFKVVGEEGLEPSKP
jgi:hypothetical protein